MLGCVRVTTSFNNPAVSQLREISGWALSDAVMGLVNKVYTAPLLLAHHASYDSIGYRSHIADVPLDS
jgi:hypothetical protein